MSQILRSRAFLVQPSALNDIQSVPGFEGLAKKWVGQALGAYEGTYRKKDVRIKGEPVYELEKASGGHEIRFGLFERIPAWTMDPIKKGPFSSIEEMTHNEDCLVATVTVFPRISKVPGNAYVEDLFGDSKLAKCTWVRIAVDPDQTSKDLPTYMKLLMRRAKKVAAFFSKHSRLFGMADNELGRSSLVLEAVLNADADSEQYTISEYHENFSIKSNLGRLPPVREYDNLELPAQFVELRSACEAALASLRSMLPHREELIRRESEAKDAFIRILQADPDFGRIQELIADDKGPIIDPSFLFSWPCLSEAQISYACRSPAHPK